MGKAIEANWDLAKTLYCQGLAVNSIAERIGVLPNTLKQRIKRGQWSQLRADTVRAVLKDSEKIPASALPSKAKRLRDGIIDASLKAIEAVNRQKFGQLNTYEIESATRSTANVARTAIDIMGIGASNVQEDVTSDCQSTLWEGVTIDIPAEAGSEAEHNQHCANELPEPAGEGGEGSVSEPV